MPEPDTSLPVVYLLRVVLRGISPLIWRRLLVAGDTSIAGLHEVLQVAFGWSGDHFHCFKVHGREYGLCYDCGPIFRDDGAPTVVHEVLALERGALAPNTVGLQSPLHRGRPGPARRRAAGDRRRSWRPASPIASLRW